MLFVGTPKTEEMRLFLLGKYSAFLLVYHSLYPPANSAPKLRQKRSQTDGNVRETRSLQRLRQRA